MHLLHKAEQKHEDIKSSWLSRSVAWFINWLTGWCTVWWINGLLDWLTGPVPSSTHKRGRVYGLSTLSISKVHRRFLNVPIYCHTMSPAGEKVGLVWLQEGIFFFSLLFLFCSMKHYSDVHQTSTSASAQWKTKIQQLYKLFWTHVMKTFWI